MSLLDDISGFFSKNKTWLDPLVSTGMDLYGASQKDSAIQGYNDAMRQGIEQDYNSQKANYDAYNKYLNEQYYPWQQASQAAAGAAAAARAKNARMEEDNRLAASKKAAKIEHRGYKNALALLQPYINAGQQVLPQMTNSYLSGLNGMNMLGAYLQSPQFVNRLNQSVPAAQTGVPLPDYIKR